MGVLVPVSETLPTLTQTCTRILPLATPDRRPLLPRLLHPDVLPRGVHHPDVRRLLRGHVRGAEEGGVERKAKRRERQHPLWTSRISTGIAVMQNSDKIISAGMGVKTLEQDVQTLLSLAASVVRPPQPQPPTLDLAPLSPTHTHPPWGVPALPPIGTPPTSPISQDSQRGTVRQAQAVRTTDVMKAPELEAPVEVV